ncbi:MAG: FKBP-type peptidyl-prolyl cis-trans isomerase [Candidatus Baldrarchaeia archaeon]
MSSQSEAEVTQEKVVKKGDFVLVDYVAKEKDTGKVFYSTIEEVAKKANIYDENRIYEPELVIVGEGWYVEGFEEGIAGMKEGEGKTFEVPPEKAYGHRDKRNMKTYNIREFRRRNIDVSVGMVVTIDGKVGVVRNITGGRVLIDFNHPLAGKTIVYEVHVRKILKSLDERIKALVRRRIRDLRMEEVDVQISGNAVTIKLPTRIMLSDGIQLAKVNIASDVLRYFEEINIVRFIEELRRREEGLKGKS